MTDQKPADTLHSINGKYTAPGISQRKRGAPDIMALVAAAVLIATPLTTRSEGEVRRAYLDPVGIATQCFGHTRGVVMGTTATAEQCRKWLTQDQTEAAMGVARCTPTITTRPYIFAASIDFSFNAGSSTFCKSSMARAFNAGKWAEGCKAFGLYRFAGGRVLPGLVRRRAAETELCLKGAGA